MKLTEGMVLKIIKSSRLEFVELAKNTFILVKREKSSFKPYEISELSRIDNLFNWKILEVESGNIYFFAEFFIERHMIEFVEENLDKV